MSVVIETKLGTLELEPEVRGETEKLIEVTTKSLDVAKAYTITSIDQFDGNRGIILDVKDRMAKLEELKEKLFRPAKQTCDAIQDVFNPPIRACKEEIDLRQKAMLTFTREQERMAAEEQERLRLEQAKAQQQAEAKLEKQAEKAEARGDTLLADELRNAVPFVPMAAPTVERPDLKGTAIRKKFKARVVNEEALWKWAIQNKQFKVVFAPNIEALSGMGNASQGQMKIDGVVFDDVSSMSVRRPRN
jgi:hypothetical protein